MVNLVTYTVFKNKLQIANIADTEIQTYLTDFITETQFDFLNKLLGPSLYLQFVQWYAIDPTDQTNAFYYLLNGQSFMYDGRNYNWVGLRKPLANYIYFYYQRNNATQTTSSGEAKTNAKNAFRAGPYDKQKQAWDEMANWMKGYWHFMSNYYGTFVSSQSVYSNLPYHNPVMVQVGVTPGVTAGDIFFIFDGTSGTPDWRGYDVFPERVGQGTMIRDVAYTWNISTGRFDLLPDGMVFQPLEYFNFTFGISGLTFTDIASWDWQNYQCDFNSYGFTQVINPF